VTDAEMKSKDGYFAAKVALTMIFAVPAILAACYYTHMESMSL
jgi:hypothetical protein